MGPYSGRDSLRLCSFSSPQWGCVSGILCNPNNQFEINFVPLSTLSLFCQDPLSYNASRAAHHATLQWFNTGAFDNDKPSPFSELSSDDILFLCELFYLPFEHGKRAHSFISQFSYLLAQPFSPHIRLLPEYALFLATSARIQRLFNQFTALSNRELLYSLYRFVWEIKEEVDLTASLIVHKFSGNPLSTFRSPFHRPCTYRGGFVADLQKLILPLPDSSFSLSPLLSQPPAGSMTSPSPSNQDRFTIRPFTDSDIPDMHRICLETGNDGGDATSFYLDDPKIIGFRWCIPYVTKHPECAFVLVDTHSNKVSGYVIGAPDSKLFYNWYLSHWIPKMQALYPASLIDPLNSNRSQDIIQQFHNTSSINPSDPIFLDYPSHLHIDLGADAQGFGLGSKMMAVLLASISSSGSSGIHLEMALDNPRAFQFYLKLGFVQLHVGDDCRILGKKI